MADLIIIIVLLLVIGAAAAYIGKTKKSGAKCIGCPCGTSCPHKNKGKPGC